MLRTISPEASYLVKKAMPVDLTSYLLSSSPPASSFEFFNFSFSRPDSWSQGRDECVCKNSDMATESRSSTCSNSSETLKPIITRTCSQSDDEEEASVGSNCSSRSQSPHSPNKSKKKVSFADHKGLALATVKIMSEPSYMPPRLRPEIIKSLTQGATAGVTEQPPLVLKFQQPASDYLAFRDCLEHNCMSLENVILRDYSVLGTVKVKNIAFEKKVFVRMTSDSWETFIDTPCTYVPSSSDKTVYDTFSFEFNVPTNFSTEKTIQFAVCFVANGHQYWDNNKNRNYEIVSADFKPIVQEAPTVPKSKDILRDVSSWTEFACWNKVDTSLPYW